MCDDTFEVKYGDLGEHMTPEDSKILKELKKLIKDDKDGKEN